MATDTRIDGTYLVRPDGTVEFEVPSEHGAAAHAVFKAATGQSANVCLGEWRAKTPRYVLPKLIAAWAKAGFDVIEKGYVPYEVPEPKAVAASPIAPATRSAHRILKAAAAIAPATVEVDGATLRLTGYGKVWRIESEDCCVHGLGPDVERVRYAYYA